MQVVMIGVSIKTVSNIRACGGISQTTLLIDGASSIRQEFRNYNTIVTVSHLADSPILHH